jgi:integrase
MIIGTNQIEEGTMDDSDKALQIYDGGEIVDSDSQGAMVIAGQVANQYAAQNVFSDYLSRKAQNTIRSHAASLSRFGAYLAEVGVEAGDLQYVAAAWQGVTHGLVKGFRNWMVTEGDSVTSINARLSAVRTYARLAVEAGVIAPEDGMMIAGVRGYSQREAKRVDGRREITRRGDKKAQHVSITPAQARQLKTQPDTPQGRRDALMMCLLLDHGLRVGEVTRLEVTDFDLRSGELRFYRPKVDKTQTHKMTVDAFRAVMAWFQSGDALAEGPILRSSVKGGVLSDAGMTERAITKRVRFLGEAIGLHGLSAHDCRHYWATFWAGKVDIIRLQEAGGWSSLAMPRRYIEDSEIANDGMA